MATITYGGDEVSALVFDVGCGTTRIGYSGEDAPKAVFPTWVGSRTNTPDDAANKVAENTASTPFRRRQGNLIGDTEIYCCRPGIDTKLATPVTDAGVVTNWNLFEELLEYSFWRLHADPTQHPLLLTDPAWNARDNREKLIELAFEKFNSPAFYLGRTPVLSAFASGKSTALIFDSGASTTSAVPVVDGYILKRGIRKTSIGGNFVSQQAARYLEQLNGPEGAENALVPQYKVRSKVAVEAGLPASYVPYEDRVDVGAQFHTLNVLRVLDDFKQMVCHTSEQLFNEKMLNQRPVKTYEFPSGYNNLYNVDRFKIPEVLFNPKEFVIPDDKAAEKRTVDISFPNLGRSESVPVDSLVGCHELVLQAIASCDVDLRAQMFPNIVVTGGNSLLPGFVDRLRNEIAYREPAMRTKVYAAGQSYERKFAPWIGGSILSSLGTFHELWISKQEYDEFGASGCEKRI